MTVRHWTIHEVPGGRLALVVQPDLLDGPGNRVIVPAVPACDVPNLDGRLVPAAAAGNDALHMLIGGV